MAESLRDLISTGKLQAGTVLHHQGRHAAWNATATVVEGGLRVGSDSFETPSGAARAVTKAPVDGWQFWRLPDGRYLDALRPGIRPSLVPRQARTQSG